MYCTDRTQVEGNDHDGMSSSAVSRHVNTDCVLITRAVHASGTH